MKIDNVKQIETLLKTLRKQGVTHYKTPEMELVLGPMPRKASRSVLEEIFPEERIKIPLYNGEDVNIHTGSSMDSLIKEEPTGDVAPPDEIKTPDMLTEEQLLDWSVREEPGTENAQ